MSIIGHTTSQGHSITSRPPHKKQPQGSSVASHRQAPLDWGIPNYGPACLRFGQDSSKPITWKKLASLHHPFMGEIQRYEFSNGMQLYAIHRDTIPLASFGTLVQVGARHETDENNGISHFLEHLIFKGTDTLKPREFDEQLEQLGVSTNGLTSPDYTFYPISHIPKGALSSAIRLQSELLQHPAIPPDALLKERFVVAEEIQDRKNPLMEEFFTTFKKKIYGDHPYQRKIIGPMANICDLLRRVTNPNQSPEEIRLWEGRLKRLQDVSSNPLETDTTEQSKEDEIVKELQEALVTRHLTPEFILSCHPFNKDAAPMTEEQLRQTLKIQDMSRDTLVAYHQQHYRPDNQIAFVVGDFEIDTVLDTLAEAYKNTPTKTQQVPQTPSIQKVPTLNNKTTPTLPQQEDVSIVQGDISFAVMKQGYPFPSPDTIDFDLKEWWALKLLARILGNGHNSRLYQGLVKEKQLVSKIRMRPSLLKESALIKVDIHTKPEQLDAVRSELREMIQEVIHYGITEKELKTVKMRTKRGIANTFETQHDIIDDLPFHIQVYGEKLGVHFKDQLAVIDSITLEDLQAVAKKYLQPEQAKTVILLPEKDTQTQKALKEDTPTHAPVSSPVHFGGRLKPSDTTIQLDNGAELIVRQEPNAPQTSISVHINQSFKERPKMGTVTLLKDMMESGNERFQTSQELTQWVQERGIDLSISPNKDKIQITAEGFAEFNPDLFELVKTLLTEPLCRSEDLDFTKNELREKLSKVEDTSPILDLVNDFVEMLLPENHPYEETPRRFLNRLDSITKEDILQAYHTLFRPDRMTISVVGNIKPEEAQRQVEAWFKEWPTHPPTQTRHTPRLNISQNKLITRTHKNATRGEIVRGWMGPSRQDKDWIPFMMLDHLLSGGKRSRLFETLRDQEALCYSVGSQSVRLMEEGIFLMGLSTSPKHIPRALSSFQEEINTVIQTPPTEKEMERIRNKVQNQLLAGLETGWNQSTDLAIHRGFNTLSTDEIVEQIHQVTPEEIQAVAKKYLSRPSLIGIVAPETDLEHHHLPVNGEQILDETAPSIL